MQAVPMINLDSKDLRLKGDHHRSGEPYWKKDLSEMWFIFSSARAGALGSFDDCE